MWPGIDAVLRFLFEPSHRSKGKVCEADLSLELNNLLSLIQRKSVPSTMIDEVHVLGARYDDRIRSRLTPLKPARLRDHFHPNTQADAFRLLRDMKTMEQRLSSVGFLKARETILPQPKVGEEFMSTIAENHYGQFRVQFNPFQSLHNSDQTVTRVGSSNSGFKVVLKCLRAQSISSLPEADLKEIRRKTRSWSTLDHKNVLPFLGTTSLKGAIHFVLPWTGQPSLPFYLRINPEASRIRLLREVSDGMNYLHENGILHGNLRADNVVISGAHHALVCDFGLSKWTRYDAESSDSMQKGAHQFRSPEIWNTIPRTFKCDTYAFGMTVAQVLKGSLPFPHYPEDNESFYREVIIGGERPSQMPAVARFGCELFWVAWAIAGSCWDAEPRRRPSMKQVKKHFDRYTRC